MAQKLPQQENMKLLIVTQATLRARSISNLELSST